MLARTARGQRPPASPWTRPHAVGPQWETFVTWLICGEFQNPFIHQKTRMIQCEAGDRSRVEEGHGSLSQVASLRFPSSLIELDV